MKAKDLAKLLEGVNPEAYVYIDLGISHDKTKQLIYEMMHNPDFGSAPVERIEVLYATDGALEVLLLPYDGEYSFDEEKVAKFFEEYALNNIESQHHEPI